MQINFDIIKSKTQKFIESDEGQEFVSSIAIPEEMMIEAAQKLADIIRKNVHSGLYGNSINKIVDSGIIISRPVRTSKYKGRNTWAIDISFDPSMLHRDSLEIRRKGRVVGHTSVDGIDNIMSLLDTGYPYEDGAQMKSVRGYWRSRWVNIKTPLERAGDHFMSDSVNEFNALYGQEYFCYASIVAPDEYYMRISD